MVNNLPANAGDIRNTGSIHVPGRSCGQGNGNPHQYSLLKNSMAEVPGGLPSMGLQRVRRGLRLNTTSMVQHTQVKNVIHHIK